jgi:hypothetical protein
MPPLSKQVDKMFAHPRAGATLVSEGSGGRTLDSLFPAPVPLSVVPSLEGTVVSFFSPDYQEASRLQMERYSRACKPGEDTFLKYQETVDVAPQHAIPFVVRRRNTSSAESIIGTARLELPAATSIEAIVRFRPDSPAASALSRQTFAEVGVFATRPGLSWGEVLDVIDTVVGGVVQMSQIYGIERVWLFPRRTLMSLLLADIPGLLPPYRFTLCPDVAGWNEDSERLKKMRSVGMKEVPLAPDTLPTLYQITPAVWAEDLTRRLAVLEQRQHSADLPRLLPAAMRQSLKEIDERMAQLHAWSA